ncbi:MAG: flagellar biosynthetic protein FliO [Acidobacteriota bacterium]
MAREMAAMWRRANGLVRVPGQLSHQASDPMWNPADVGTGNSDRCTSGWRNWIPALDRTPPLWQFFVRLLRWWKTTFHAGAAPSTQLRLVGQLALGAKRHLSLVEVGGAQFLVGGGVEDISVIVPVPAPKLSENLSDAPRPHPL